MYPLRINKSGVILTAIDSEISLGRLIYLIKDEYPQIENEKIKIINKGKVLQDNDKKLSDLGVSVNKDRLIVIPATIWKFFE